MSTWKGRGLVWAPGRRLASGSTQSLLTLAAQPPDGWRGLELGSMAMSLSEETSGLMGLGR